jgi:YidC/Oxa1 family membrane protein insertase
MIALIKTIIYIPLYNFLILILNIPYIDAGLATIALTIIVKIILFPITKKTFVAQHKMKGVSEQLNKIKEQYPNKEEQALKVMQFYKDNKINPFSGILSLIIQIPIIYSLYHIFFKSGLPSVNTESLYSFVSIPESISMNLLGIFDVAGKSIVLALLAAVSTYLQMHLANMSVNDDTAKTGNKPADFSKMLASQMKYTLPFIVFFISWNISGVVALYWFTSNIVSIIQDSMIKKSLPVNKSLANTQ